MKLDYCEFMLNEIGNFSNLILNFAQLELLNLSLIEKIRLDKMRRKVKQ